MPIFSYLKDKYKELKSVPRAFQLPYGATDRPYTKPPYQTTSVETSKRLRESVWTTACIQVYCKTLPSVKFVAQKWDATEREWVRVPDHPIERLIDRPNDYQHPRLFFSAIITSLFKDGNALVSIKDSRALGRTKKLEVLHPDGVIPCLDPVDLIEGYKVSRIGWWGAGSRQNTKDVRFVRRKDMIHIQFVNPEDFTWGISPLEAAKNVQDAETMAVNWNKSVMFNSGRPSFVLTTDDKLSPNQRREIRDALVESVSRENSGLPLIIPNGLVPHKLGQSPVDMDYYKSSLLDCYRICSILGVPPAVINILENATLANARTYMRSFYTNSVLPLCELICEAFSHHWIHSRYGPEYRLWYDASSVSELREDLQEKIGMVPVLADKGFSMNEISRFLGLGLPETEAGHIRQFSGHIIDTAGFDFNLPVSPGGAPNPANGSQIGQGDNETGGTVGLRPNVNGDPEDPHAKKPQARKKPYGRKSSVKESEVMRIWNSLEKDRKIYTSIFYPRAKARIAEDIEGLTALARMSPLEQSVFISSSEAALVKSWTSFVFQMWRDAATMAVSTFEERFGAGSKAATLSEVEETDIERISAAQAALIVGTTSHWVLSLVNEALAAGMEEKAVVDLVRSKIPEISAFRAEVIVENEVLAGINYGNRIGAIESGVYTEKTWRTQRDNRVRLSHVALEGETKLLSEPYSNGLRYPGDPDGAAEEIINCRCFETYA